MAHSTSGGYIPASDPSSVKHRKQIWKVFWILLVITTVEFIIAFTLPANGLRVAIFVGMTFVKAFYIVAEFMHLKHEVKMLIWSIVLPIIFIMWFIVALIVEGGSVSNLRM